MLHQISKDDIEDIHQISEKIEKYVHRICLDNQLDIALSALIRATVHTMINQAESLEQLISFRNATFKIFDMSIIEINKRNIYKPPNN